MGGVLPYSSREFCRFLLTQGFEPREGGVGYGDHKVFRHPKTGGIVQVPCGGQWSKKVPRRSFKDAAEALGLTANALREMFERGD